MWKFLKQNVLFPKGLNWVQHWVSRIGLCLNHTLNECLGPSLLGWNLLAMVNRAFSIMPFSIFTYTCTLILFKIFWKSLQLYIISVRILQLVSVVHETCLSDLSGFLQIVQWLIYHYILEKLMFVLLKEAERKRLCLNCIKPLNSPQLNFWTS